MIFKLSMAQEMELLNQPETGMGYQIVNVILKSGKILRRHKVVNAELLMLDDTENISIKDIDKIEMANRK